MDAAAKAKLEETNRLRMSIQQKVDARVDELQQTVNQLTVVVNRLMTEVNDLHIQLARHELPR